MAFKESSAKELSIARFFIRPIVRGWWLPAILGLISALLALTPFDNLLEQGYGLPALAAARNLIYGARAPDDIVIVSVEQQSFFQYPESVACLQRQLGQLDRCWPRPFYGLLADTLKRYGAELVVLNVLFPRSREDEDAAFAKAIRQAGNVLLQDYMYRNKTGAHSELIGVLPPVSPIAEAALASAPFPLPDTVRNLPRFWHLIPSVTFGREGNTAGHRIALPAAALHVMTMQKSWDGLLDILRRLAPSTGEYFAGHRDGPRPIDDLMNRLLQTIQQQPSLPSEALGQIERGGYGPEATRYLSALFKLYRQDDLLDINVYGPSATLLTIPFHEVEQHPELFRGKVVFVGLELDLVKTAKGGSFDTPFAEISSTELLATAYANLLDASYLYPYAQTGWQQAALIFLWAYLLTAAATNLNIKHTIPTLAGLAATYAVAAVWLLADANVWLPLVSPLWQIFVSALVGVSYVYFRFVVTLASVAISPELMPEFTPASSPVSSDLREYLGACLVTDAQGFTALADSRDGEWLARFMSEYQTVVGSPVAEHRGIVKDWAGDGMMALWLQPFSEKPEQESGLTVTDAVDAALRIRTEVERFTLRREVEFPIRIGINYGPMWISGHGELKAFGDTLNMTQRLEALNKVLSTRILISLSIANRLQGYAIRNLGTFLLPGKKEAVPVFELIGPGDALPRAFEPLMAGFAAALNWFETGYWARAYETFSRLHTTYPDDGPTEFYLAQCRERLHGELL
ncbi:CHASE2 domain-containing protein [Methylococcus sp. EFPC2]|uniref:CHASE2 domain-containing protein n=1 Tax=Methylococcus sp. EFPC2 TaxID=2812648 RepID=UPI00196762E3|nr:adenylate/guanylate cyclase domain-containing protein [Methylococcus sp. EFPC2]QSA98533.1 adenylate/guanylate cyclase domain-containing protein [Methylococcus sp. EFPC2]